MEKTEDVFEVTVDKPRLEILNTIEAGKKNFSWTDSVLGGSIDYQEIEVKDGRIEIIRKPLAIVAFGSFGTITIDIKENENGKSQLMCEVQHSMDFTLIKFLFGCLLTLWTIGALIIIRNLNGLIMIIVSWSVFGLFFFLLSKYFRWQLREYARKVISELSVTKASR
jgi:hypothetical protein